MSDYDDYSDDDLVYFGLDDFDWAYVDEGYHEAVSNEE
jgi:hypothetical protein